VEPLGDSVKKLEVPPVAVTVVAAEEVDCDSGRSWGWTVGLPGDIVVEERYELEVKEVKERGKKGGEGTGQRNKKCCVRVDPEPVPRAARGQGKRRRGGGADEVGSDQIRSWNE